MAFFNVVAEGNLDIEVARRILSETGHALDNEFTTGGKGRLDNNLAGYNAAANYSNWLVLRDLDNQENCAVRLANTKIQVRSRGIVYRIVQQEIEAWLLADKETLAEFLAISRARIPDNPEQLQDAKLTLTNLARASRRREIREGIPPTLPGGRSEGPAYTFLLSRYVQTTWNANEAANSAPTLQNTLRRLAQFGV